MRSILLNLAQALGIVMLADFAAGIIHWLEDAYFTEDTPVIGPLFIGHGTQKLFGWFGGYGLKGTLADFTKSGFPPVNRT